MYEDKCINIQVSNGKIKDVECGEYIHQFYLFLGAKLLLLCIVYQYNALCVCVCDGIKHKDQYNRMNSNTSTVQTQDKWKH